MCGRNDAKKSGSNEGEESQETNDKTTTTVSSEVDCSVNNFNTTGCEITLAGKLLIVLDGAKDGMIMKNNGFKCFCELVYFNLNGTSVTAEVLTGSNKAINCSSIKTERVNETFLEEELKSLGSVYNPKVGEAGMAVIVSESSNVSGLINNRNFPDEKEEPFIYFVSVGKQKNTSIEDSCHRQYRSINDMSEISTIGSELMENACNPMDYMKNNSCLTLSKTESPISTPSHQASVEMAVVVGSVIGALILAVVIVLCLIFSPKLKGKGKSKRDTFVEFSAVDSGFGGLSVYSEAKQIPRYSSRDSQNVYNALWEKEKAKKNRDQEENYHDLDMNFVDGKADTSLYDHMKREEDLDDVFEAPG
ncbi:uncharacterized protein LOC134236133 [Saccostrea cucullata]|uniref:uncharacterized protein LOC134236133 n=1 Tax=Saccostrea cuccullata TaxID=36930 RepID=UPI002ED06139